MKEVLKIVKENRTEYIGARFTKSEKEDIENTGDLLNISNSDLMRDAIFSHINFLKESRGDLKRIEIIVVKEVD